MTATKGKKHWSFLLGGLMAIVLLIFPILTGAFTAAIELILDSSSTSFYKNAKIVWGGTLFYGTWSFLLFVMLPYLFIYVYTSLKRKNILYKLLVFYILLTIMGLVIPEGSVIDFFGQSPYPKVWILYILLTITLCPLCNIALNKIVKNRAIERQNL